MFVATACTNETAKVETAPVSCLPCDIGSVHVEEIMIETQNNARECAVRVWGRASPSPLFEVKGALGIHNCKVYVIHNAEIKTKSNKLRENE